MKRLTPFVLLLLGTMAAIGAQSQSDSDTLTRIQDEGLKRSQVGPCSTC